MQPLVDRTWVDIPFLARLIGSIEGIEGITVVGGEPMLQAQAMTSLLKAVHEDYGLSSMLYTGYRLESLIEMQDADIADLLSRIDILVDGPYVEELDYSQRWRGSENQTIHFVTDRYSDLQGVMNERGRDIEIHIDEQGNYLVLGIPPKGFYEKLEHLNEQTIYRR